VFPNLVLLADIPEVLGMAGVVMLREQQRLLSALTARCGGIPCPARRWSELGPPGEALT